MSEHAIAQPQKTNVPQAGTMRAGALEHRAVNQPEPTTLPGRLFDAVSSTFMEPRFAHDFSRVQLRTKQPMVQRLSWNERDASAPAIAGPTVWEAPTLEPTAEPAGLTTEATPTSAPAEPTMELATPGETPAPGLLVEDSVDELAPGQMRRSDFLAQLRAEVTRTAEAAMAGTGRTTADCPYLGSWFGYYSLRDSAHIERAIHRYAPDTRSATSPREYISIITRRVRRSVETWVRTGEITGVPEGIPTSLPGEVPTESGEGAVTATGPVMLKKREGVARATDDPQAIQAQLGEGHPLDGGVRSRMESAFGMDFSHVRTHTDITASMISNRLNARAFTVGEHVAFGSDEYRPGTMLGDALIAHELAHVVQQSGASESVAPMEMGSGGYDALEKDADKTAVSAITSLWGETTANLSEVTENAIPRLRSGLRLQRCSKKSSSGGSSTTPTLTYSVVSGPSATDCGGFRWGVKWSVKNATSSTNGWVAQKVELMRDVKDCSTPPNAVPYSAGKGLNPAWCPLWEAWQVRGGSVFVGKSTSPHQADTYGARPIGDSTKGNVQVKGTAEYYDGLTLPSSFTVTNAAPTWALPATKTQPTLSGGTGAIDHSLKATWDCCTSVKTTTITTSSPP